MYLHISYRGFNLHVRKITEKKLIYKAGQINFKYIIIIKAKLTFSKQHYLFLGENFDAYYENVTVHVSNDVHTNGNF